MAGVYFTVPRDFVAFGLVCRLLRKVPSALPLPRGPPSSDAAGQHVFQRLTGMHPDQPPVRLGNIRLVAAYREADFAYLLALFLEGHAGSGLAPVHPYAQART